MSVTLAAEATGTDVLLEGHEGYGLASFSAGVARTNNQRLVRHPTAADPAHVHVVGQKTSSVRNSFARESILLIEPSSCKDAPPEHAASES